MLNTGEAVLATFEPPSEPAKQAGPDKYKIVTVRLRAAEFDAFCDQARTAGITSNMALRIAARRIGGFLEVDRDVRLKLEDILSAIGEISKNIRRLHADYIASGKTDLDGLAAQRAAFGEEFAQLDSLLRSILNISQRRLDGLGQLTEPTA